MESLREDVEIDTTNSATADPVQTYEVNLSIRQSNQEVEVDPKKRSKDTCEPNQSEQNRLVRSK
jgi:hypothetical protein